MATTTRPSALTASDLMSRDVTTISQDTPLRAAAELFFQRRIGEAAVVDADGRCVGILSATDLIRWALGETQGGIEDVGPPACPYQVRGRLLTGGNAVICTRTPGSCPLQEMRPMTGGRHTAVCRLREGVVSDWQEVSGGGNAGAVRRYVTAGSTVEAEAPLSALAGRGRCPGPQAHRGGRAAQANRDRFLPGRAGRLHPPRPSGGGHLNLRIRLFAPEVWEDLTMFQTIIHPTDFDEPSKEAFRVARSLARSLGARVVVLHVVSPPAIVGEGAGVVREPYNAESVDLWAEYRTLQADTPDVHVQYAVVVGHKPGAKYLLEEKIRELGEGVLVVMGTHARTGLRRLLWGNLAEEVVRDCPCPVLVVKAPPPKAPTGDPGAAATASA
jgi:nucleotide-binding universal stress UspA family protein